MAECGSCLGGDRVRSARKYGGDAPYAIASKPAPTRIRFQPIHLCHQVTFPGLPHEKSTINLPAC
jgi:hypothetical protein